VRDGVHLDWTGVSWLAVVVAAVVGLVIGFVWFLPQVFGRQWAAASGRELPARGEQNWATIAYSAVGTLVAAYVLALAAGAVGATTLVDGALLSFLAWLGFIAPRRGTPSFSRAARRRGGPSQPGSCWSCSSSWER
jgi:hypothetical protein